MFCQWVQLYGLGPDEFRAVVRTFQAVFPDTWLFETIPGSDVLLIGGVARLPEGLPLEPILTRVVSAHVMGGSTMSSDPSTGVTRPDGRLHGLDDVSVHDGSLFPTSIGANPQLSVYALAARLSDALASALSGRAAAPLS